MLLEGTATDLEDGPLSDDTLFSWQSDREGELGIGRSLLYDDLLPGQHTVTLTVADSEGYVSEDSVTIFIASPLYLPLTLGASP